MKNKFLILSILLLSIACAKIQAPPGGPEDNSPPKLLSCNPGNKSNNISKYDKIELNFDEPIRLQKIIFSPPIDTIVEYKVKNRQLEMKFISPYNLLQTLNIQLIISDLKGNMGESISLLYSDTSVLDTSFITGKIINRDDHSRFSDIIIGAYSYSPFPLNDSHTPDYKALVKNDGSFKFEGLSEDIQLYIYSFSKNTIYSYPSESKSAFEHITIYLTERLELKLLSVDTLTQNKSHFTFNKAISAVKTIDEFYSVIDPNNKRNVFVYYENMENKDTLNLSFTPIVSEDFLTTSIDTSFITSNLQSDTSIEYLHPIYNPNGISYILTLSAPIENPELSFKKDGEDSFTPLLYTPINPFQLLVENQFDIIYDYQIRLDDSDSLFKLSRIVDLSTLEIKFSDEISQGLALQLISESNRISFPLVETFQKIMVPEGEYTIFIYRDLDGSGNYSAGGKMFKADPILDYKRDIFLRKNWVTEIEF